MPKALIESLSNFGEQAADKLALHFLPENAEACAASGIVTTWENHRWVRLLSTLAGAERLFSEFEKSWSAPAVKPYQDLLDPAITQEGPSYRDFSNNQRNLALCYITGLHKVVADCQRTLPNVDLVSDTPRPPMHFRLTSES